ncbi:MAG: GldG family protein [Gammaproteobacteria bacterium]|nr:GldG family protein [Gammaproteobacteria bacterium]
MKISPKLVTRLRIQQSTFIVLFLALTGLLAFLSYRYDFETDWTMNQRNTLSEASQALLQSLDKLPEFTIYATEEEQIRRPLDELLQRYKRAQPGMKIQFVNPELEPDLVRELGISVNGEIVIELNGRQEQVTQPTEQNITNAIQRVARPDDRWLLFAEGHAERKPEGIANHDLGEWGNQLKAKGIKIRSLNLTDTPVVPQNTAALVIASPQLDYLPGEVNAIQQFIKDGGNLLWLTEPGNLFQLQPVADLLGLEFLPGTIVDPNTQLLGIDDPRFAIVSQYSQHPLTSDFSAVTLFPKASGVKSKSSDQWQHSAVLQTMPRSWSETGELTGQIEFDAASDVAGPLVIGMAVTRDIQIPATDKNSATPGNKQQRILVLGDGDFLSNTYLGNGGNLKLGLNMVNWLAHDDRFIAIPARTSPDVNIELSSAAKAFVALGFLILLPLLLGATGTVIWLKRRRR